MDGYGRAARKWLPLPDLKHKGLKKKHFFIFLHWIIVIRKGKKNEYY